MRGVDPFVAKRMVDLGNGMQIESDVLSIVSKIQDYDPNLIVQFVDPTQSDIWDAPYQIMELCPDGLRRPVMQIWELDDRVLERLYACDKSRHDLMADLNKKNAKAKSVMDRRYKEEVAAVSEMVQGVLRSPKDTYTATNPVTGQKHTFRSLPHSD